jgi:hypothetical protein
MISILASCKPTRTINGDKSIPPFSDLITLTLKGVPFSFAALTLLSVSQLISLV